jgi:DNA-binding response OmpR family regulator
MGETRILVVEDDPKIRALLRNCFEAEGYRVDEASDAAAVARAIQRSEPDLVTLDINLDGDDGLDIARTVRREHELPIIFVTGKDDVIDRVVGLELGADDYITKPFHVREMLARVKAVLRRSGGRGQTVGDDLRPAQAGEGGTLMLDGLRIDPSRMAMIDRSGADSGLTTADFKLLMAFLNNAGRALSRDRLMDLIEGPAWVPLDRTIDNQVARLRKKVERDPARPALIKTVRGVGYMLTEAARDASQPPSRTA